MTGNVTKRKPRLFYLDWVRGLSAILIVITHFNNPYLVEHPIFWRILRSVFTSVRLVSLSSSLFPALH